MDTFSTAADEPRTDGKTFMEKVKEEMKSSGTAVGPQDPNMFYTAERINAVERINTTEMINAKEKANAPNMDIPGYTVNHPGPHMNNNSTNVINNSPGIENSNGVAKRLDNVVNTQDKTGQIANAEKDADNEGLKSSNKNTNNVNSENETVEEKVGNHNINMNRNEDMSEGFLSPPVFHLTEIMHNEKCFKKTKGHIAVEINGDICIYGGMAQNKCVNNFIRYVPGIKLFEKIRLNSEDIAPRAFHSGNVISENNKNSILIFGGINDKEEILDETYKFDFQAKKWERIECNVKPCARYKHASFSYKNSIFIHGGMNSDNATLSDLWHFSGGSWNEITPTSKTPEARYGHTLVFSLYGNAKLVFLFGGNRKGFNGALGDTWVLNLNTLKWKEITKTTGPNPRARWAHSAQLFDEWMIIYGGITNGWIDNYALSDMYALNIYTFSWFEVDISRSKCFNRGYYGSLCLVPYKKSLHIFGGSDESDEFSDAFSLSPLVTYVYYKNLTEKIENLDAKMKIINENTNSNDQVNLTEFELKISELKGEVNNISNMMKTFEMKFFALEKLNEQCEKLLSKNMNAEALEKLEQRIRKLESSNILMKHESI
ncbi:kelch domain-containing protein [Plasmodium gonderi]|uniref:Kelch domain-containing protein n=1 Tax=Plasmodium gonderi TaxID=77519 RepID=A0A1Y1JIK4_PLAGO|nr:kelch domain-containing protein [Plasmodium gonderi]GAW81027.1 kelch domain-containing protein [Plasmodium gonderi]